MSPIARLHEALAHEGLVPESERVHYLACSNDYRTRFREAFARSEIDDEDLKEQLASLQQDHDFEERRANRLQDELNDEESRSYDLKQDVKRLEGEIGDLEEELASVRQQLEDANKAATQETATP